MDAILWMVIIFVIGFFIGRYYDILKEALEKMKILELTQKIKGDKI